jgi:hypothetical protein
VQQAFVYPPCISLQGACRFFWEWQGSCGKDTKESPHAEARISTSLHFSGDPV